jgi:hypothetical protein
MAVLDFHPVQISAQQREIAHSRGGRGNDFGARVSSRSGLTGLFAAKAVLGVCSDEAEAGEGRAETGEPQGPVRIGINIANFLMMSVVRRVRNRTEFLGSGLENAC